MNLDAAETPAFGLLSILIALGRNKWKVVAVALCFGLVGTGGALLLPPIFTARTLLLPPAQSSGATALSASLGALASVAGLASAGGVKSIEELYVALLRTDTVSDKLIDRFKLRDRYGKTTLFDTRRELTSYTRISGDRKSGLVIIEVDDEDPKFAATLANAYCHELRQLLTDVAVTEAQQRRLYYVSQFQKAKEELARAEKAARDSNASIGIASLDVETQSALGAAAQLRAQVVQREVQLQVLKQYAGPVNQDVRRLEAEILGIRTQLAQIERGAEKSTITGAPPSAAAGRLESMRLYRDLKFQESIYSAMQQQLFIALADEGKEAPIVQQVETAAASDKRSKPHVGLIGVVFALMGLLGASIWTIVRAMVSELHSDPKAAAQLNRLFTAWSFRKTLSSKGDQFEERRE